MPSRDREDYDYLLANARAAKALDPAHFRHFDQPLGILNYIRIANDIAGTIAPGRLLDWGCGSGQMTYLLRRRGFETTGYDVGPDNERPLPDIPLCRDLHRIYSSEPTALPFDGGVFDAVLSCGALEHVDEYSQPGNELKSLREIGRVLRPGGTFLIYQLPQRNAWQEALIRRFRLGYSHPRRFTRREITALLAGAGYRVERVRRANLFPKNLTGIPERLRTLYGALGRALIAADGVLAQVPPLAEIAGVMEIVARKQ